MKLIFACVSNELTLVNIDDVMVFGKNFNEHPKCLDLVLERLAETGLKFKETKCKFFQKFFRIFFAKLDSRVV